MLLHLAARAQPIENTEREEIIRGVLAVVGQFAFGSAHTAAMAHNVSMRTMQNLRREVALVKCENTKPIYELKSENYVFDRELTKEHIEATIEANGRPNFSELARSFPVFLRNGKIVSNGNQILKQFAIDEGLFEQPDKENRRQRRWKRMLLSQLSQDSLTKKTIYKIC